MKLQTGTGLKATLGINALSMVVYVFYMWVKIGQTLLFTNDQNILLKNMWLTDNIVFAAEQLLNQQHPYISGLQDPCLQQVRTFAIQGNKEFVQCLIVGGNHWITISSVGCNPGTINVYDSMNCNKLTSNLKGIVALTSEMEGVSKNESAVESRELCDLAEGYSFILQSVLGVLAFSTLICKYTR